MLPSAARTAGFKEMAPVHWLLFGVAAIGFGAAFFSPSGGFIGVGMLVGFVCLFAGFFVMIGARIAERSRSDAALLTDADVAELRRRVREAREKAAKTPLPEAKAAPPSAGRAAPPPPGRPR